MIVTIIPKHNFARLLLEKLSDETLNIHNHIGSFPHNPVPSAEKYWSKIDKDGMDIGPWCVFNDNNETRRFLKEKLEWSTDFINHILLDDTV